MALSNARPCRQLQNVSLKQISREKAFILILIANHKLGKGNNKQLRSILSLNIQSYITQNVSCLPSLFWSQFEQNKGQFYCDFSFLFWINLYDNKRTYTKLLAQPQTGINDSTDVSFIQCTILQECETSWFLIIIFWGGQKSQLHSNHCQHKNI